MILNIPSYVSSGPAAEAPGPLALRRKFNAPGPIWPLGTQQSKHVEHRFKPLFDAGTSENAAFDLWHQDSEDAIHAEKNLSGLRRHKSIGIKKYRRHNVENYLFAVGKNGKLSVYGAPPFEAPPSPWCYVNESNSTLWQRMVT